MSPKSAFPPDYTLGPDNQSWLMRSKKKVQFLLAAGPRVPSGFWKWREIPELIFVGGGEGNYRFENTDGTEIKHRGFPIPHQGFYLSRIQPNIRWHVALHWPIYLNFHVIYRDKDVAPAPTYQSDFGITKMFTFAIGYKRDSDRVYIPTAFIGGNFE